METNLPMERTLPSNPLAHVTCPAVVSQEVVGFGWHPGCIKFLTTGNSKQLCGGPASLTIWGNTLYVAPTLSLPAGWAPADPLCIMEVPGRALTGSFYAADNMTVDSCVAYCNGMGFPYAAVEYGGCRDANSLVSYQSYKLTSTGRECMCGTSLVNGASFNKPSNACTMQCAGSTPSNRQVSPFFQTSE